MNIQSAGNFPGATRVHIALAVTNLERSRTFYETLLGVPPVKERPGYVKFEPEDPSINLTLNEVPVIDRAELLLQHYGIQVKTTQAVHDAIARFSQTGLRTKVEENTTCCYALQDKVWVTDPDGNPWEIFVVLDADASERKDTASTCCVPDSTETPVAACC